MSGEATSLRISKTIGRFGEKPVEGEIQEDVCGEKGAVKKEDRCQGQQVAKRSRRNVMTRHAIRKQVSRRNCGICGKGNTEDSSSRSATGSGKRLRRPVCAKWLWEYQVRRGMWVEEGMH